MRGKGAMNHYCRKSNIIVIFERTCVNEHRLRYHGYIVLNSVIIIINTHTDL